MCEKREKMCEKREKNVWIRECVKKMCGKREKREKREKNVWKTLKTWKTWKKRDFKLPLINRNLIYLKKG